MYESFPALRPETHGTSIAASFSSRMGDALTLDELSALYRAGASMHGAAGHRCVRVSGGKNVFVFGDAPPADSGIARPATLAFRIAGWDEHDYEFTVTLLPECDPREHRASLHAMSSLYLCRALALIEAEDDLDTRSLTATERFCLEARASGQCGLDIAEDLDRSVHAVEVHLQRAARKLAG